jgi:hypothetical protein
MEIPHRYPYNPPLWLILLSFGSGFLWIGADWLPYWLLPWGHIPTGFRLWESLIGLIPIALALIVGVRRIWVERYLLLDDDGMVLPLGLFQMWTARIEYTSIRRVWRHYVRPYEYRFVLKVATEEQAFTILPAFLPDNQSYRALEESLNRKLLENTRAKKSPRNQLAQYRYYTQ